MEKEMNSIKEGSEIRLQINLESKLAESKHATKSECTDCNDWIGLVLDDSKPNALRFR